MSTNEVTGIVQKINEYTGVLENASPAVFTVALVLAIGYGRHPDTLEDID